MNLLIPILMFGIGAISSWLLHPLEEPQYTYKEIPLKIFKSDGIHAGFEGE